MSQQGNIQFNSEKLRKGYKPIVTITFDTYDTLNHKYYASKTITLNGQNYVMLCESLPNISRSVKYLGGMSCVGMVSISIINQAKESDFLRTVGLGFIMGYCLVAIVFDDGTTPLWAERLELFFGKIDDLSEISIDSVIFNAIDKSKLTDKLIGTFISITNYPKAPQESYTKIKPLIYGNHPFNIDKTSASSYSNSQINNLVPMLRLEEQVTGVNAKEELWYLADHQVDQVVAIWGYDDQLNVFVKLIDYTVYQNTSAGCLIKKTGNNFYHYVYPKGADRTGTVPTAWNDKDNCSFWEYPLVSYAYCDLNGLLLDQTSILLVQFPERPIPVSECSGDTKFFALAANTDNTVFDYGVYDSDGWNDTVLDSATNMTFVDAGDFRVADNYYPPNNNRVSVQCKATTDITGSYYAYLYYAYLRMQYVPSGRSLPLYAEVRGHEYSTWINGRSTVETDPNTGLNYSVTHPDDDGAGNLIENPVGVIESVLRDILGFTNIDLEVNSFNVAASKRSNWKFSFAILEQSSAIELLDKLAFECQCWLFWNYANRLEIVAYDAAANFSASNTSIPISDDIFIHQPEIIALNFNNTADAKIIFSGGATHQLTGNMTFECWAYFNNFADVQTLISCGANSELEADNVLYLVQFTANNNVQWRHEYDAGLDETVNVLLDVVLNVTTWYHIAVYRDYDNNNIVVQIRNIKGELISSGNAEVLVVPTGGSNSLLRIGIDEVNANPMNGMMKEIRLWNDVRSFAELSDNCSKILTGNEDNLVGYWRLDEGAGTIVDDITANSKNGTVGSGCSWSANTIYPDLQYYAQHPIIQNSFSLKLISTGDLANSITVNYLKSYFNNRTQKTINITNSASIAKYGTLDETIKTKYITDQATAQNLADKLLNKKKEKYYIARFKTWLNAATKTECDIINIRHPLLDNGIMTNANMKVAKWQIIRISHDCNNGEIEIEAIILAIP